jgi:predicted RNA-binding protein with PUA-like domain
MKIGELAFFYHSNCKVPGIAGLMEVSGMHAVIKTIIRISHHDIHDP